MFEPYAEFNRAYFDMLPPDAKILGCDPDFDFEGNINSKPDITNEPWRTAAGHIHVGWRDPSTCEDPFEGAHFADCKFLSQHFYELYKNDNKTETEIKRLQAYGDFGSFRPKPYGVELRQYSNLWVAKSETRRQMFDFVHSEVTRLYKL